MGAREGATDELGASPRGTVSFQEVTGYQTKPWRVALCHACSVLTAGLLLLLFHWKPSLEVRAKCEPCALGQADWVIIRVSPRGAAGAGSRRLPIPPRSDPAASRGCVAGPLRTVLHHACADGGAGRRQVRAGLIPHGPFNPDLPFLRQLVVLLSSFSKLLSRPLRYVTWGKHFGSVALTTKGCACSSASRWGGINTRFPTPSSLEHHPGARPEDRRTSIAIGVADEEESRDTIRLHEKEEVAPATPPLPRKSSPWAGAALLCH